MKSDDKNRSVADQLIAGGLAGLVAKTAIAPFDRIKIHFQVGSPEVAPFLRRLDGAFRAVINTYRKEGVLGMYRGHSVMCMRILPYAAINFMSFDHYKKLWIQISGEPELGKFPRLIAGSLAGATSVLFTYPLDILRTRLAFEGRTFPNVEGLRFPALFDAIRKLWREGKTYYRFPLLGFYQGFSATLLGIIPYAGVSFFTYETANIYWNELGYIQPAPWGIKFLFGMLAGALGQTASYPLDVARRRIQIWRTAPFIADGMQSRPTTFQILKLIVTRNGVSSLFTGLSINYLKVAPTTGISFVVYEYTLKWLR